MAARVMVVDDILPNVKLLEAKLSTEYYDVVTATSGQEALDKLDGEQPDLILLDVMMPGMDGFEVCEKIKANPETAHIPVVMVTALTASEDKVRGLEAGADDFLSKPINDTALMARVSSLVRLKISLDEWRMRENTASQLGVVAEAASALDDDVSGASILVVEDKSFEQSKIAETLAQDDHHATIVTGGLEAMERIAEKEYDVLMISIDMENEDGIRLCSHLKSNERARNVPILMVADENEMQRIAHGLEIGAHDYILRPIDKNELRARIRTQIRRKRFHEKLRSSYEMSLSMALTDSLTGLYNRRYLEVHLERILQKSKENNKSIAVLMLDIDHFKSVNDTHGHGAGDEVLKVFSARLMDKLRSFDLVARMGGEEFVVILPDATEQRSYIVAERLRRAIADEPIPAKVEGGMLSISTSIGGVIAQPNEGTMEEILKRADKCLYEAKESGRNCIVFEGVGKLDPDIYKAREREETE